VRKDRPRLEHAAYAGAVAALLTFCTSGRRPEFQSADTVERTLTQFLRAGVETHVALVAYCFMPDHVHLLVQTTDLAGDVARFARLGKQYAGYSYGRETGQRLWQPGWHDRLLRRSDDMIAVIRYVLQNPIRAGLAREVQEYPFVGSAILTREALLESAMGDRQT
jgi:putative transposase